MPRAENLQQRLLTWALPAGEPPTGEVEFRQVGRIRLAPTKPWLRFRAHQWMSASRCAFAWHAWCRNGPGLRVRVRDAYEGGRGCLTVKLWGVLPVARADDDPTSLGELQRYLAEIPWCPHALLANADVVTEARGGDRLRLVANADERTAVDLHVGVDGRVTGIRACRPRGAGPGAELTSWGGRFEGAVEVGSLRVPERAQVWWDLPEGRFEYFEARVSDYATRPSRPHAERA